MLHYKLCADDLLDLSSDLRYDTASEVEGRLLYGQMELYRPAPHLVWLLQLHPVDHYLPAQVFKSVEAQGRLPDRSDDLDSDQDFLLPKNLPRHELYCNDDKEGVL